MSSASQRKIWEECAYITSLSDGATKTEYLFTAGAQFVMGTASQQTYNGKPVTVINMTEAP